MNLVVLSAQENSAPVCKGRLVSGRLVCVLGILQVYHGRKSRKNN